MTVEDARKIVTIMETADGGCPFCAMDQIDQFQKLFPELDIKSLVSEEMKEQYQEIEDDRLRS